MQHCEHKSPSYSYSGSFEIFSELNKKSSVDLPAWWKQIFHSWRHFIKSLFISVELQRNTFRICFCFLLLLVRKAQINHLTEFRMVHFSLILNVVYNAVLILFVLFSTKEGHACHDFLHFSKQRNLRERIGLLLPHLQWSKFREGSARMENNLEVMLHRMDLIYSTLGALDYWLLNSIFFPFIIPMSC